MTHIITLKDWPALRARLEAGSECGDAVRLDRRSRWGIPCIAGE